MNRKTCLVLLSVIGISAIIGCGGDSSGVAVTQRPGVTQTSPQDGAVNTNLNPRIEVWFDQALEEATIDSASFHMEGAESHRVEYVDSLKVINLYLKEILEPESTYTAVVTTDIMSTKGKGMLTDFTFSFTTGTLDKNHLIDYMEPNDDMDSPPELEVDKTYTVLSSCGDGEFDFFKFKLTEAAMATLRIDHSYSELDSTGWLMRFRICGGAFYRTLFVPLDTGESINLRHSFLPGTYCVETGNTEASTELAVYDLTLQTSTACADDEYEDNDFMWEAKEIVAGTYDLYGCNYDTDYFRVVAVAGQTLTATISQVTAGELNRRLRISDAGNVTLREFSGTLDPMTLTFTAGVTGNYHIVVDWWEDTAYELSVDIMY